MRSSNSIMGIYPEKTKTLIRKDIRSTMSIAALFTIAKIWKQPMSTHIWIDKDDVIYIYAHTHIYIYVLTYTHIHIHTYTVECYVAIKRMKSFHLQQHGPGGYYAK